MEQTFCQLSKVTLVVGLAASLVGCSSATEPFSGAVSVRTSSSVAIETRGALQLVKIPVTITNTSAGTLYVAYCSESIEQVGFRESTTVWGPICLAVALPPRPIAPGATLTYTVQLDFPTTSPRFDLGAKYRVSLGILADITTFGRKGLEPLPHEFTVSNEFRLTN